MALSLTPVFFAATNNEENVAEQLQTIHKNKYNKIHFYFDSVNNRSDKKLSLSSKQEIVDDAYCWVNNKNELKKAFEDMSRNCGSDKDNSYVTMTIEFESGLEKTDKYQEFVQKRQEIKTIDELREFRSEWIKFSKNYHEETIQSKFDTISQIDYADIEHIDYSPFVTMNVEADRVHLTDLEQLVENHDVVNVSLSQEETYSDCTSWNRTLKEIEAYNTVKLSSNDGSGIKIGVLEATGVCDVQNKNLKGKNITIDPSSDLTKSKEHATAVTSILALMAPKASFYVSNSVEGHYGLSWLIGQGCDVINCSFGWNPTIYNGKDAYIYTPYKTVYNYQKDAVYDYQIKANFVSIVTSAGNRVTDNTSDKYNPEGYICSPGLAYSAITVGSLDCELSGLNYKLSHNENSNYLTSENRIKPEISAIATVDIPNDTLRTGTSFAAPQVTAALALMFCKYPAAASNPTLAKSMTMASANKTSGYTNMSGCGIDEKVGVGCLSLNGMLNNSYNGILYISNDTPNTEIMGKSFSLKKNDVLQASLVWDVLVSQDEEKAYVSNYDLRIYNSSGALVCSSTLGDNSNVEFLRYTVPSGGHIQLKFSKTEIGHKLKFRNAELTA